MSEWNKPVFAQPGAGMSVLANTLEAVPGAKPIVVDVGPSARDFVTAPPRTGMSVLVSQETLALAATSGAKPAMVDIGKSDVVNVIRDSLTTIFNTVGNALLEAVVITFRTRSGEELLINPFDQSSIDAAKKAAPGEGVGPAVSARLIDLMRRGLIGDASLLPAEYRHLGALIGTTQAQAEAVLANCNTSIQLKVGA